MSNPPEDYAWMARALQLAAQGQGAVEPNPMVGAVLVSSQGTLVGEGFHERYGQAHAEANALTQAGEAARGATLYVTLEPCSHFGKTPPCADAVIRAGVRRVVAAMLDPFPQVSGKGVERLRQAGIIVEVGVGEATARLLNAPYLKRLREKKPWVIGKWAMTLDGRIASRTGHSQWITGPAARAVGHTLRGRVDAILVGRGTFVADDPQLTARPPGARTATRIVVTTTTRLPERGKLLETIAEGPVAVYSHVPQLTWTTQGADVRVGDWTVDTMLTDLARRGATNILLEGGGGLLGSFRDAGELDEVYAFVAPRIVGGREAPGPVGGIGAESMRETLDLVEPTIERLGDDWLIRGVVRKTPGASAGK